MNEKINEIRDKAINKADELYNKLPLDKINEKLGGKVDVKTKKFKIIAAAILVVLFTVIGGLIFGGSSDSKMSSKELEFVKKRVYETMDANSLCGIQYVGIEGRGIIKARHFTAVATKGGKIKDIHIFIPKGMNLIHTEINGLY